VLWDNCGMARSEQSLSKALAEIPAIREEFWEERLCASARTRAATVTREGGRVADFLRVRRVDGARRVARNESCGGHFREEYQTEDGEALRDDEHYAYVAAWESRVSDNEPELHKEPLNFEFVHPSTRS